MPVSRRAFLAALLAGPAAAQQRAVEDLERLAEIPILAELDHVQGIDVEGDRLWISSVDRRRRRGLLHLIELPSGRLLRETEVHRGERYHPGGLQLDGEALWLPVAEYRPKSSTIQRREKGTLELLGSFSVADHIGCVAASPDRLYGGNWDAAEIYEWDRQGRELSRRPRRTGARYQDLKFYGGTLIAAGLLDDDRGAVDWLNPATLELERRLEAGRTGRGVVLTHEGMAVERGRLYLLPEDGPSRLFVFRLPARF